MTDYKSKRKLIIYSSRGPTSGLTDVKLQLWDSDRTRVVTDGVMTEEGAEGKYYYSYTPQKVGTHYGSADSATKPYRKNVEFVVVNEPNVRGGRCFYEGPEWTAKEKKAILELTELMKLSNLPKASEEALKKMHEMQEKTIGEMKRDLKRELEEMRKDIIEVEMGKEMKEGIREGIEKIKTEQIKEIKRIGDQAKSNSNEIQEELKRGMNSLKQGQEIDQRILLEATDEKTLAKILDSKLK